MEWLIAIAVLSCVVCPHLLVVYFILFLFYCLYSVFGWGIIIPVIGLVVSMCIGSLFDPAIQNTKKKVRKAKEDYDSVVFRWYNSDEYWEDWERQQKKKKPNKAHIRRAERLIEEQDKRSRNVLPIAEDYLKKTGKL